MLATRQCVVFSSRKKMEEVTTEETALPPGKGTCQGTEEENEEVCGRKI